MYRYIFSFKVFTQKINKKKVYFLLYFKVVIYINGEKKYLKKKGKEWGN